MSEYGLMFHPTTNRLFGGRKTYGITLIRVVILIRSFFRVVSFLNSFFEEKDIKYS